MNLDRAGIGRSRPFMQTVTSDAVTLLAFVGEMVAHRHRREVSSIYLEGGVGRCFRLVRTNLAKALGPYW